MKTYSKIALGIVAGAALSASGMVLAHGPMGGASSMAAHGFAQGDCKGPGAGTMGYGPHMGAMQHGAGPQAHLDSLKSELNLKPDQQAAWDAFERAVREQFATMSKAQGQPGAATGDPEAHIQFMEQRLEGMKAVAKARAELLKTLTPEQKAAFGAPPRPFQHRG